MFGKRLNDLSRDDIERLISEEVQESGEIEFKKSLPTKDGRPDPWLAGEGRVGRHARNEILEEAIAFANA